jgi:HSP20 family protein
MNKQHTRMDSNNPQAYENNHHKCGSRWSKMFSDQCTDSFESRGAWGKSIHKHWGGRKAVNIEEDAASFKVSLYAAGLVKSNFKISVSEDILTIAYQIPENTESDQGKYTYQEYAPVPFERSFQLNGKVLTNEINAVYTDGVLFVTLPKNPDSNKPAQVVDVN